MTDFAEQVRDTIARAAEIIAGRRRYTRWYPATLVNPPKDGIYQIKSNYVSCKYANTRHWYAGRWYLWAGPPRVESYFGTRPGDQWRGIKKKGIA